MKDLILALQRIKAEEIKILEEDGCPEEFIEGVKFGMNFFLKVLKDLLDNQ